MANNIDVNYKNNFFEYPELTRIHGAPPTATPINLNNEVRANAQVVQMVLGGGNWGHLELVCTTTTYVSILDMVS